MNKHFLSLQELTRTELEQLFFLTDELKSNTSFKPLTGKTVIMVFQKPSLRTRIGFEVGIRQLGGDAVVLSQEWIGIGKRESAEDVARLLGRYGDMIVARLFEHDLLLTLAKESGVPIVNALTGYSHPCQILADLYTMRQHGKLTPGVKVVFVGDGNNVVNSWLEAAAIYPMHFTLACPEGYEPDAELLQYAQNSGVSTVEISHNPQSAVFDADVIYTDVWVSMGQEAETEIRQKAFTPFQVNDKLIALAKSDCLVMHCLPANRGEEITDSVMDGANSVVFDQGENRLHTQKALLATLAEQWAEPHNIQQQFINELA